MLDNFPENLSQMDALQQAGILPDIMFCLRDSDENQGTKNKEKIHHKPVVLFKYTDSKLYLSSDSVVLSVLALNSIEEIV